MVQNDGLTLQVIETEAYQQWLSSISDRRTRARINTRIRRTRQGNLGNTRPVGDGVSEMRLHFVPGYRVYYIREGATVIVLLGGGDKDTQPRDIRQARRLAARWRVENA